MRMLEIENLHVSVDDREILRGIDLKLGAGEVHAIMGPNGSGKFAVTSRYDWSNPGAGGVRFIGRAETSIGYWDGE